MFLVIDRDDDVIPTANSAAVSLLVNKISPPIQQARSSITVTNARASADDRHIFFSAGASHLPTSALRASPRMVLFALNELRSCRKPKDPKGTTAVGRWKLREAFHHANRANRTNRARKPRKY